MSKKEPQGGFPAWWLFFALLLMFLNVFFISFLKNQRIGVTGRSPCRLSLHFQHFLLMLKTGRIVADFLGN
ncbi:hypothetical protein LNP17_22210 [Klebsiella variicola subsp. variicola]|nr:hypothetical protein [Klebsiella variicola subsp. variicola]